MTRKTVLPLSLLAAGVAVVCVLSVLAMGGHLHAPASSQFDYDELLEETKASTSTSALATAEKQLSSVRATMEKIQKEAEHGHLKAAKEGSAAAKDRHLEKELNQFAKTRQLRAKELKQKQQNLQKEISDIHTEIGRLQQNVHAATLAIKQLASHSQAELHSKPVLRKEIADTTQRLLDLTSEHQFLEEKAKVLSAAAAPHEAAYKRDEADLYSMELHIQQLKAQSKLYSAQAGVIADNLSRRLKALKADQHETSQLKKESAALPPRSSVKFATPKFVSLAAKAKAIYTKAGSMISKVQTDNEKALSLKKQLLHYEQEMSAVDQKAAAIDLTAAKTSDAASTQKYLASHFEAEVKSDESKLLSTAAALKRVKLQKAKAQKQLKAILPTIKQDKIKLKQEEKQLLADQTDIDTEKARALNAAEDLRVEATAVTADVVEAQKDLRLAVGAARAAKIHEQKSAKLASEAAEEDDRVTKLTSELEKSDKKVEQARALEKEADNASEELAEIDSADE